MSHRDAFLSIGAIALLVLAGWTQPAQAQPVCGDGVWEPAEWCGQDAIVVTGVPDMNHDCIVNLIDVFIFGQFWPPNPPATTADLTLDGLVSLPDLATLAAGWGMVATPCGGSPPPGYPLVLTQGTIAMSFSANPATIVSTAVQNPGVRTVHVVIDGWSNADITRWSIEHSANIVLLPPPTSPLSVSGISPITCTATQAYHSAWASTGAAWASGPILFATMEYWLLDANPAWIRFTALQSTCYNDAGPRWGETTTGQFYEFADILNVGINGGIPGSPTGIGNDVPSARFEIVSLAPNPFNPSTTVNFTLPAAMPVTASVLSVDGTRVRVLSTKQTFGAGDNNLTWDGRDDRGSLVASGVYFVRLETRLGAEVKRAVLLK
jgi:hypothetical protein